MEGYLFVYFTGEENQGEQIYFSLSEDGLHWKDANGGRPVLISDIGTKGIRDPFILRSKLDGQFYMIGTDLCIADGTGWREAEHSGSRDILIFSSGDLVHWSKPWTFTVPVEGAGCAWAPEAIFDEKKQEYVIYWASMMQKNGQEKQMIYMARTKDFHEFYGVDIFIERNNSVIDTTMIYENGIYYRFSKNETSKYLQMDKSRELSPESFEEVEKPELNELYGVEGPIVFKANDGRCWYLFADQFASGKGYLPLATEDLEHGNFRILSPEDYDLGRNKKRHGSILAVTGEEMERIRNMEE